jgi:hypothetical protein
MLIPLLGSGQQQWFIDSIIGGSTYLTQNISRSGLLSKKDMEKFKGVNQNEFTIQFQKADNDFYSIYTPNKSESFIDTIKVKALVSYDYSYCIQFDELKIEPVFVTYLLQIRKHYYPYHPDYSMINEPFTIEIIGYLGEHGEPLSKIINVWQTKSINK